MSVCGRVARTQDAPILARTVAKFLLPRTPMHRVSTETSELLSAVKPRSSPEGS